MEAIHVPYKYSDTCAEYTLDLTNYKENVKLTSGIIFKEK